MNYHDFRMLWHEALDAAGLLPHPLWPAETLDLRQMSRAYSLYVSLGGGHGARPFYTTAELEWNWNATLSARSATTEEDLLIEVLGQDGYDLVTERPWIRVDVTLNGTLPWDSPLPMPDAPTWRRWVGEVTNRLAPILPIRSEEDEYGVRALSWCGEPEARARCGPDGRLYLRGVYLSAWQGIDLPRQWDNPDRELDDWPEVELADFTSRVNRALQAWESCLKHLLRE
jgi:hypothetical protein